jgi:hypothetical protein
MVKLIKDNFLVVSDYNWLPENIEDSWVNKYSDNYLIYDRYHRFQETSKIKHQKNVGQNIYDMFDFIVNHYDELPDVTIFCRACLFYPKDDGTNPNITRGNCSEEHFNKIMNNKTFTEVHDFGPEVHNGVSSKLGPDNSFLEINTSWYFNHHKSKYYNNINTFFNDMYVNPPKLDYIRFSPGGNYIIPKENILKNSKKFYERIRDILSWDIVIGEAHMIERAIYTIFTCDWVIKDEYK